MSVGLKSELTTQEKTELEHHLRIIKSSFIQMVKSLGVIYYKKLYRGDNGKRTWAEFCQQELNFSSRYGYYFVQGFNALRKIDEYNEGEYEKLPYPSDLSQLRALSGADDVVQVWKKVAKTGDISQRSIIRTKELLEVEGRLTTVGLSQECINTLMTGYNTSTGKEIIDEILTTGYLQTGDFVLSAQDIRPKDILDYETALRREKMLQKIAEQGGVTITIYPDNPQKTAAIIHNALNYQQLNQVIAELRKLTNG